MDTNHMEITSHISKLIDHVLPHETSRKAKQKYLTFCTRLLGSRIQSANIDDPDKVKTMITRKLLSAKSSKYGTKNSDVLKFEQLYNKLTKK